MPFDFAADVGAVPRFTAPQFQIPGFEALLNDPGYLFRLGQGRQALESSAAAKGVLRTGGTLQDILGFGQSLASTEYANFFNRALEGFDRTYRGARDEYAPELFEWQTKAGALQRQSELEWLKAWQRYFFERDLSSREEQSLIDAGAVT